MRSRIFLKRLWFIKSNDIYYEVSLLELDLHFSIFFIYALLIYLYL